jgi:hypothetical protein
MGLGTATGGRHRLEKTQKHGGRLTAAARRQEEKSAVVVQAPPGEPSPKVAREAKVLDEYHDEAEQKHPRCIGGSLYKTLIIKVGC